MLRSRGKDNGQLLFFGVMVTALVVVWCALAILTPVPETVSASEYGRPEEVGRIESAELKESSGLAASECQDVLWTHNDAGNEPVIFAMNTQGRHLGVWRVPGVQNIDWESIAGYRDQAGKCFLLIGDIGDNDLVRPELLIYRIPEPMIAADTEPTSTTNAYPTPEPEVMRFVYGDKRRNAETLLVHPATGNIYIVTKEKSGPATVQRMAPAFGSGSVVRTEKIADISVPSTPEGRLTGGSYSPDGRRVMLCDLVGGYELVLPDKAADPDAIWAQKPVKVDLGARKQGEGVSYARDGLSVYASSEKKNAPIYRITRKTKA